MHIFEVLKKIYICIGVQYMFMTLIAIFIIFKDKSSLKLFIIPLFMIIWRLFVENISSRYCTSFIAIVLVCILIAIKKTNVAPLLKCGVILILTASNIIMICSKSDKYYIDSLRRDLTGLLKHGQTKIFANKKYLQKEYYRIFSTNQRGYDKYNEIICKRNNSDIINDNNINE